MSELVEAIKRVASIMTEITGASREQSAGVNQVNQAVAQIDEATQQNAALVEESASAAELLKDQARQLVEAVAVFILNEHAARKYSDLARKGAMLEHREPGSHDMIDIRNAA